MRAIHAREKCKMVSRCQAAFALWATLFVLPAALLLLPEGFQRGQGKAIRGTGSLANP